MDASLSAIVKNSVFSSLIFSAEEIFEKMKSNDVDEVMVDFPMTNVPDTIVVRHVKDANRVTGILKLWRGEIT